MYRIKIKISQLENKKFIFKVIKHINFQKREMIIYEKIIIQMNNIKIVHFFQLNRMQ